MSDADRRAAGPTWAAGLTLRPRLVLATAVVVGVIALWLASHLELRTALSELLPSDDPAVLTLKHTEGRVGDLNLLMVGIRSPDRVANLAYAKALTDELRRLPPSQVGLVAYHLKDLQAFFHEHRWMYGSVADLEAIRDRLRQEILKRKNPLVVELDEDPAADDAALRARVDRSPMEQRFPEGYFVRGDVAWVLVLPAGGLLGERAGEDVLRAATAFVAQHPPAQFHPAMRVQALGPVVVGLENRRAIEQDIIGVTIVCIVVIGLSIALYFRRIRAVPLVVAPAALGTAVAFAAGKLAFGYLNSSTAFLGSIILGNGINHAIILLSRYQELAHDGSAGRDQGAMIAAAARGTGRATFTAAAAAAASYLSLTLTSFRGFSQFGVMAAVGSLACWASAYTLMPAWFSLGSSGGSGGRLGTSRAPLPLGALARLVSGHSPPLMAGTIIVTIAALYGLLHFARSPFEYDFRKLRADVARTEERKQLDDNLNDLLGRWHSPTVVLADRLDQVESIRAAIHRQDSPVRPLIGQVVTIYDVLPGPPAVQRRKLALLGEIRKLARDPAMEVLSDKERADLVRLTPPESLRELTPMDLPPLVRRPFTERDGTLGRVVLVYHAEGNVSMWDGRDLIAIARVIERLRLDDGTVIEASGVPMVFGAMLRSVLRDGPRATLLSLMGVALLLLALVRPARTAWMAIGTLFLGVIWMVGSAGLLRIRITFLNFIALPITFGVGGEYAINLISRWRRERSVAAAVRSVGGAVLLCSWTTIVGYGSLLAAHSQALRGFGAMAILGEISCLLAALVAAPAWLGWRASRGRLDATRGLSRNDP